MSPLSTQRRPFTILVAALGGEGGGVLADWLLAAAQEQGYVAQSTSIPGVAQRTGATTYYLEIFAHAATQQRLPVMALIPSPGAIDLVAASELVEAGRALQNAFVTPERTTLVASSHRIYATAEKMLPVDGRYEAQRILAAAPQLARRAILFDMQHLAREAGSVINAVLFGAMAGAGVLPVSRAACEAAMRSSGKGAEASLRGFALGYAQAAAAIAPQAEFAAAPALAPAVARVHRDFPEALHELLDRAVERLVDYQDAAYAALYLDRVAQLVAVDEEGEGHDNYALTRLAARLLALWMAYEDVIRVADLKTRAKRYAHLRAEAHARPGEPLRVFDYLKPGVDEFADLLPPRLASALRRWHSARRRPLALSLQLQSSAISGFLALRLLALLKPWRRRSARFAVEQTNIERWLAALRRLAPSCHHRHDRQLPLLIADCARLVRGYGDTQRRGQQALQKILGELPQQAGSAAAVDALKRSLRAALDAALGDPDAAPPPAGGKTVIWLKAG